MSVSITFFDKLENTDLVKQRDYAFNEIFINIPYFWYKYFSFYNKKRYDERQSSQGNTIISFPYKFQHRFTTSKKLPFSI